MIRAGIGLHPEREGKKNGDGGRGAETGEDTHHRSKKTAGHSHKQIVRGQYQSETMPQTAQGIHGLSSVKIPDRTRILAGQLPSNIEREKRRRR